MYIGRLKEDFPKIASRENRLTFPRSAAISMLEDKPKMKLSNRQHGEKWS